MADQVLARVLGGPQHGQVYEIDRDKLDRPICIPVMNDAYQPWEEEYIQALKIAECPVVMRYPDLHPFFLDDLVAAGEVVAYIDYDSAVFSPNYPA